MAINEVEFAQCVRTKSGVSTPEKQLSPQPRRSHVEVFEIMVQVYAQPFGQSFQFVETAAHLSIARSIGEPIDAVYIAGTYP